MGITNQRSKSHAAGLTARLLAPVLMAVGDVPRPIHDALGLLGRAAQKYIPAAPGLAPSTPSSLIPASSTRGDGA